MYYYINGSIVKDENARIPINDRGFLFGDGLFETVAFRFGRKDPDFEKHIKRINKSASLLGYGRQISSRTAMKAISLLLKKNGLIGQDAYVKIIMTRGIQTATLAFSSSRDPLEAIIVKKLLAYDKRYYREGASLSVSSIKRSRSNPLYAHKMLNYFENVFAKQEAQERGFDEALFLTEDDMVLESSTANIFAVSGEKIMTPRADGSILEGVTRSRVISLCRDIACRVSETEIHLKELFEAEGVFLTNSIMGVMPVGSIEGRPIGKKVPCRITGKVMDLFASSG
jgi:branched-chain amino acid aminotransferase